MFYGLSDHKPRTHMKLVCCGADNRVVGLHVVGQGADEMLQVCVCVCVCVCGVCV